MFDAFLVFFSVVFNGVSWFSVVSGGALNGLKMFKGGFTC